MYEHMIVVPAIDPTATERFMLSMSTDIRRERVIIVDNTDDGVIAERWAHYAAAVIPTNRNAGVAAAWNRGMHLAFEMGATYVTNASTSIRFNDGAKALCRTADVFLETKQCPYGFESMNGWKLATWSCRTFEEVGPFDEAFWPAYFEDNDYIWRLRVAGLFEPRGWYYEHGIDTSDPSYGKFIGDWQHRPDGDVVCDHFEDTSVRKIPWIGALDYPTTGDGSTIKNDELGITVDYTGLRDYYIRKWGGPPGEETSTVPLVGHIRQE